MDKSVNAINWFEIPVSDMQRAKAFYENIFQMEIATQDMMDMNYGMFPYEMGSSIITGALAKSPNHHPGPGGVIIYLNGNPDIQLVLDRVVAAGGKIMMPKTPISPEIGAMAVIIDTEGNNIGLHSNK